MYLRMFVCLYARMYAIYIIYVKNKFSICRLYRQHDGFAPTFAKKPSIRQEDDGKRLLFECRLTADPAPDIVWFHNGTKIKDSLRHNVSI